METDFIEKGKNNHNKKIDDCIQMQRTLKDNIKKFQEPILEFGPTGNIPYLLDNSQLFRVEKKAMIVNPNWS